MVESHAPGDVGTDIGRSAGTVTLVEESTFCLSGRSGDVRPGSAQGLFFLDTRLLSTLLLTVDGRSPEPLTVSLDQPFAATFVAQARAAGDGADSSLLVLRRRYVGRGMREDITLRNSRATAMRVRVHLAVDADFADLFAVKEARAARLGEHSTAPAGDGLLFGHDYGGVRRTVTVRFCGDATVDAGGAAWDVQVPPQGVWSACVHVEVTQEPVEPLYRCGEPVGAAAPAVRHAAWQAGVPQIETDHDALRLAVATSLVDLGSLRLFETLTGRTTIAAGAPWFMTLFGRDSLLTAYMSLIVSPELALGVLDTLAELQGAKVDPLTEEQPGRILHEVRYGQSSWTALAASNVYYGSADATALFVMLLGELDRWGLAPDAVQRLLPHADRALDWITRYGDRDGDGYVEYARHTESGLANQGWKDSWDGVPFADGRLAEPPIALCEVQGYVYAAYIARAFFAEEAGDADAAAHWRTRASDLKTAFNRDFWLPDRGYFALALDGEKRPVDALASNMGHCLWTGIVDVDKAPAVAAHLLSPEMFNGWGIRTLATSMASYNPLSYHCGSVWPHDNGIVVAGLMRYGFVREAHQVIDGILAAASAQGGRLPELFAGISRDDVPVPVPYPASCSPQAWSAATPLQFLRSLLRLDPWVPHGKIWVDPALPGSMRSLSVTRIPMAGQRLGVRSSPNGVDVSAVDGIELIRAPRPPLTASRRDG
ncbi:MAG TPA: glycogen debranching N-terminal domain-containing protein [Mycobacteriales bacterium]|jgi:glycogen debranching enzyme|nr:glycogen debranching N-terminal domain-containing protein [Mycobacteriales bacterium]